MSRSRVRVYQSSVGLALSDGKQRVDFLHRIEIAASGYGFAHLQQTSAGAAQRVNEALLVEHDASSNYPHVLLRVEYQGLPHRIRRVRPLGADNLPPETVAVRLC
jgi:hypothetical protein